MSKYHLRTFSLPACSRFAGNLARFSGSSRQTSVGTKNAWKKVDVSRPLRYALEVRHKSFITSDFFDLLREHNIAFVFADTARKFPYAEDLTADLVYIRLHGAKKLY